MASRRKFLKNAVSGSGAIMAASVFPFYIKPSKPRLEPEILGHGDFTYRIEREWGDLNPNNYPVNNCHEMVMDRKGRLIMLTDHPRNNVIIYDTAGKLLETWTLELPGAHGLSIADEGGAEYLFITDPGQGRVLKTSLGGRLIMELDHPSAIGAYESNNAYRPTETAIAPNGDIYVADGYGSQFILQYDGQGNFIRKFGGDSFLQPDKFKQVHGVAIDYRDPTNPTLLCSARIKNTFKRFSLDGKHLEDFYLPGAFISRPVLDGENLYSGVCFGMTEGNYNMQLNRGFVTILDKDNKVVSNPGGTAPVYMDGKLQLMMQEKPVFKHCHDVCVDGDKNVYVCQWNAGGVYPYKLHRV
jgi:peptidylamidoglycolate lyase